MNRLIGEFLFEVAMHGTHFVTKATVETPILFNPYQQFPKYKPSGLSAMDKRFLRHHGSTYNLYPELSRSGLGVVAGKLAPATTVVALQVGAGYHIGKGGAQGIDLYTGPQRRRVEETGITGYHTQYRAI